MSEHLGTRGSGEGWGGEESEYLVHPSEISVAIWKTAGSPSSLRPGRAILQAIGCKIPESQGSCSGCGCSGEMTGSEESRAGEPVGGKRWRFSLALHRDKELIQTPSFLVENKTLGEQKALFRTNLRHDN